MHYNIVFSYGTERGLVKLKQNSALSRDLRYVHYSYSWEKYKVNALEPISSTCPKRYSCPKYYQNKYLLENPYPNVMVCGWDEFDGGHPYLGPYKYRLRK